MCVSELKNRQSISYWRLLPAHIEPIFTEPFRCPVRYGLSRLTASAFRRALYKGVMLIRGRLVRGSNRKTRIGGLGAFSFDGVYRCFDNPLRWSRKVGQPGVRPLKVFASGRLITLWRHPRSRLLFIYRNYYRARPSIFHFQEKALSVFIHTFIETIVLN